MSEVADRVGWRLAEWEHPRDEADLWRSGSVFRRHDIISNEKEHVEWSVVVLG
jgi:hypothetical protein